MPMMALAPAAAACSSMSWKASSRARSHSSVYSVILPPKSVWIVAPMLATTLRERTVMPRTTPRLEATRYPSNVKAVVTHWRGMGMAASVHPDAVRVAGGPGEVGRTDRLHERGHGLSSGIRVDDASAPVLRLVRARLYYPRLMSRPFEKAT